MFSRLKLFTKPMSPKRNKKRWKINRKKREVKKEPLESNTIDNEKTMGIEDVLNIHLIRDQIFNHLSLGALKSFRLVSKKTKNIVSISRNFLSAIRLRLDFNIINELQEKDLSDLISALLTTPWTNINVDMREMGKEKKVDFRVFLLFGEVFAKCLDLIVQIVSDEHEFYKTYNVGSTRSISNLFNFLALFKSMKYFAIDSYFCHTLEDMNLKSPGKKKELEEIFDNLKGFKIVSPDDDRDKIIVNTNYSANAKNNWKFFSEMTNLVSFENDGETSFSSPTLPYKDIFQFGLYHLAAQSAASIVKLQLNFDGFLEYKFQDVNVVFPSLKKLEVISRIMINKTLVWNFMKIQPLEQLRRLSLVVFQATRQREMPREFIPIISRCRNLLEFEIKAGKIPELNNWEFLTSFPHLRNLKLFVPKLRRGAELKNNASNEFILSQLSDSIRELTFRGMNIQSFSSFDQFHKLDNLARLSLLDCSNCIDDEKLNFIFTHFLKLETLEFSHSDVTDEGIWMAERPNNLLNLKHLKKLRMISCSNITNFSCQFGLKFMDLEILDLSNECLIQTQISNKGVKCLIENNPSLVQLLLCQTLEYSLLKLTMEMSKKKNINIIFPAIEQTHIDIDDEYFEDIEDSSETDDSDDTETSDSSTEEEESDDSDESADSSGSSEDEDGSSSSDDSSLQVSPI